MSFSILPIDEIQEAAMRKMLIFIALVSFGCSTDIDIIDNQTRLPIIYAILNPFDSAQVVRVHRMFPVYRKSDWQEITIDSTTYQDVEVKLSGKKGDQIKWTVPLLETAVDLDSGFFPSRGFKEYMINHPLPIALADLYPNTYSLGVPDIDSLILEVTVNDLDLTTRSSAPVIGPHRMAMEPGGSTIYLFGQKPTRFYLPGGGVDSDTKLGSVYQQIEFRVHYKDFLDGDEGLEKEVSWVTSNGWDPYDHMYYPSAERLFNRMKLLIPKNDQVVARILDSIDVQIISPSRWFSKYWEIKDYWEMTDNPPFSNFDHSYGLFCTYRIGNRTGLKLNRQSMDTLCNGYLYKEMKFKNW
jgi:hypothetical protein